MIYSLTIIYRISTLNYHTNAEAVDSTAIDHSTSHSLPERDHNTVSGLSRDVIIVYMKYLLPIHIT